MTSETLLKSVLEQSQADGVTVALVDSKLAITGPQPALADWRPVLRELTPELLALLRDAARPINRQTAAFVRRGVDRDTAHALALQLATRAARGDDRHACIECQRMTRARDAYECAQGRRIGFGGTPLAREQVAVLHRCQIFAPLDDGAGNTQAGATH
jgi:hypothetical protein